MNVLRGDSRADQRQERTATAEDREDHRIGSLGQIRFAVQQYLD